MAVDPYNPIKPKFPFHSPCYPFGSPFSGYGFQSPQPQNLTPALSLAAVEAVAVWQHETSRYIGFIKDCGAFFPGCKREYFVATKAVWQLVAAAAVPLRVQVPNNHTLAQNLYYNYYYPNPKYLIIGYMDPLGS